MGLDEKFGDNSWLDDLDDLPEPVDPKKEMLLMFKDWWNGKEFTDSEKEHYGELKERYCANIYYDYLTMCMYTEDFGYC